MDGRDYLAGTGVNGYSVCAMWGVPAFLLNYVPNIGSRFPPFPMICGALLFNGFTSVLPRALLVVHMVIGNIMEPRMMGHRLGMSTLVVFLFVTGLGMAIRPGRDAFKPFL